MADAITPILASSIPRTVNKVQKKTIETNLHGFCNKCSFYLLTLPIVKYAQVKSLGPDKILEA